MITSRTRKILTAVCIIAGLSLVLLSACSEKEGGTRVVNIPPETRIAFGPQEDSLTYFKVQVFWFGTDEDGDIEHFLVKTVKGSDRTDFPPGFDWDSLEGWGPTSSRDSTFVLSADSCCLGAGDVKSALALWGVLVRAVDNEGMASRDPAMLFFKANNVLPKVGIIVPEKLPIPFLDVPPHPYVEWEGEDPDGEPSGLMYKYIVIPEADLNPKSPRLPPLDHEGGEAHASPPAGMWSRWVPADCTFVRDLDLSLYKGTQEKILVYVTVKDEGGAFLPEKLYGSYNGGANWIRFIVITTGAGVTCMIDGGPLGVRSSKNAEQNSTNVTGVFQGTEISFRFWGIEDRGRGEVADAYKYYWDSPEDPASAWNFWTGTEPIRQRGTTPEWFVRFPLDGSRFAPSLGRHVLVVKLKDLNRVETSCEFNLEVLEGPRRAPENKILVVDDDRAFWLEPLWNQYEDRQDALWADILDGYNWEEFDTGRIYDDKVPIRFVANATTTIWIVDEDIEAPATHLLQVCTELGNYLYSYVKVGGNLIIIGKNPVYACGYWPDGTPNPDRRPTVTRWDFKPQWKEAEQETVYNFNWDIFGIREMKLPSPTIPFTAVWPCEDCYPAVTDTIELGPDASLMGGQFSSGFYITRLREDFNVIPLFGTAIKDDSGEWVNSGRNYMAVYVPSDGERGHAAFIGFPEYWFDHAKIKSMIRRLLAEFGETPVGS